MLSLRQLALATVLLLAGSCGRRPNDTVSGVLVHPGEGHGDCTVDLSRPDTVKRSGHFVLRIYYIAKGTRSEGLHGVLTAKGLVIDDSSGGSELTTDLGPVLCHGPWGSRKLLFGKSGWLPKDAGEMPPSARRNDGMRQNQRL
jgi:hypothetical protein